MIYPWWRNLQRYFPDLLDEMGFQPGFHVLPRRWVVERTFAWLGRSRRLSRDYERLPTSSEALICQRVPLGQLALAGVGIEGLAILVAAQLHVYGVVLLLWAARGGADMLFVITSYSLVQRLVPTTLLGRTITVLRVLSWPTASLGAILGGLAITRTANPVLVYSLIGAVTSVVALLFWWTPVGRGERSASAQPEPPTSSTDP